MKANYNCVIDDHIAELKKISPGIDIVSVNQIILYYRSKILELPVAYDGDDQVYNELKKHLLKGKTLNESIQEVRKSINAEYQLCRMRFSIGIRSFNITTTQMINN